MSVFTNGVVMHDKEKLNRKEDRMIRQLFLVVMIIFCMAILTGCNTIHGIGKDIQSLGELMQKGSGQVEKKEQ